MAKASIQFLCSLVASTPVISLPNLKQLSISYMQV